MSKSLQVRWDLLAWAPLKAIFRWSGFPAVLQLTALTAVVLLAINGWGIGLTESPEELKTLRKTNLTTLLVWGLWWPAMIAVALALGRAWCTVCPAELVSRAGHALGRRAGWPRFRLGRWLRAGWFVILAYLALQILVAGVSLHRVPHYTSWMLIVMFAGALGVGLLFREPRAFCEGFCPARVLLSVYGRYTPVQLDVRDPDVCQTCQTQDCVAERNRYKLDARSCPSLLRPYDRKQADGCVLCLQCAKVCPHDNVGLGVVESTAGSRRHRLLAPFEAVFVMVAAGFVAHEVIGEVKPLDEYFHWVPERLSALAPSVGFGWFEATWFLLLFPLVLWAAAAGLAYLWGHRGGLWALLRAAATGAAPIVAVAHVAKAVAKISSWAGFFPLAVDDPAGAKTFARIQEELIARPERLVEFSLVGWVMLIVLVVVGWRSWRWVREAANESLPAARAGFAVVAGFYCLVLCTWPWFPKA
ncbi:MAG: 4Fe-4S binding protein [Planctomycetota bacterium]|jgi:polyferredoxin